MTNEQIENAIEFVVKQQGEFSSELHQLQRNLGAAVNLLSDLTKTQLRMAEAQILTENRIAELAKAQTELTESQKRTDQSLIETNERLNSLIVVVERYFSNGRQNG